jgi:stage III sporulation protein SpoIIIAA
MMVPIGARQQEVIFEYIHKRSPQVMVINEIGCIDQVKDALTVKDYPVMIATAHGQLSG